MINYFTRVKKNVQKNAEIVSRLFGLSLKNDETREKSTPEIRDIEAKTRREKESTGVDSPRVYAFIDLANVFRGAESEGWEVGYEKLQRYLATRYGVTRAFVFGGTSNRPDRVELHEQLVRLGYEVLLVPTRTFKDGTSKADVDSRMTFEMMRMEKEYNRAVVFTGDGDFYWVLEYLRATRERVWLFGVAKRTARDLKRMFRSDFSNISDLRDVLAVRKETQEAETTRISASPATYPFNVYGAGVDKAYQNRSKKSSASQAVVDKSKSNKKTP